MPLCSYSEKPMNIAKYTAEWLILLTITNSKTGMCTKPTTCGIKKNKTQRLLTFRNRGSYIQDGRTATHQMLHFIYFFSTNINTQYFKYAAHSPFFSSKCCLFHNATFFGSCIIHILHTGCAKI